METITAEQLMHTRLPSQVLFDLWLDAFLSERPAVREALEASAEQLSNACASQKDVREAHQA